MPILENVKRISKEKGIAITELEEKAGMARGAIYKWNDHAPSVNTAKAVADHLGCTLTELLEEEVAQ